MVFCDSETYLREEPREQVCILPSALPLFVPPQQRTDRFASIPNRNHHLLRGASACRQVIGLVWIGSQATKPVRLALAALTAPVADRLIASTQRRLGLKKKDAVSLLVAAIFGSTVAFCLAVLVYGAARAAMVSTVSPAGPPSSSAAFLIRRRMMKGQQ